MAHLWETWARTSEWFRRKSIARLALSFMQHLVHIPIRVSHIHICMFAFKRSKSAARILRCARTRIAYTEPLARSCIGLDRCSCEKHRIVTTNGSKSVVYWPQCAIACFFISGSGGLREKSSQRHDFLGHKVKGQRPRLGNKKETGRGSFPHSKGYEVSHLHVETILSRNPHAMLWICCVSSEFSACVF